MPEAPTQLFFILFFFFTKKGFAGIAEGAGRQQGQEEGIIRGMLEKGTTKMYSSCLLLKLVINSHSVSPNHWEIQMPINSDLEQKIMVNIS